MNNSTNSPFASEPHLLDTEADESPTSAQQLGERLRAARLNKGWTQDQVGQAVGLPRSAVLQIEAGTRTVSSLELAHLARAYDRQAEEFLGDAEAEMDAILLGRVTKGLALDWQQEIKPFLDQLQEAVTLSQIVGEHIAPPPPLYQFSEPRSYKDAIEQGREMAVLERKRLDLGSAAVIDVAAVIACQSIWATALPLPEDVSGLFFRHSQQRLAVLVNCKHVRARRRFSYSHEYAHALVDRTRVPTPTTKQNAGDLVEKRANAFASEFLMPESGVRETLERMQKGAGSREYSLLYDVASDEALAHETRNDASSQRITLREIAILAHDFKVSYDVAAYRLIDIGIIKRSQLEELLSSNQKSNGIQLMRRLDLFNGEAADGNEQPYLKRQLALLAIEARRREKISDGRFYRVCTDVAGYSQDDARHLLAIALSMV